jgi:deoxyribose-phosphate aldolase
MRVYHYFAEIERQLEHHVTGRYSAFNRHPIG